MDTASAHLQQQQDSSQEEDARVVKHHKDSEIRCYT